MDRLPFGADNGLVAGPAQGIGHRPLDGLFQEGFGSWHVVATGDVAAAIDHSRDDVGYIYFPCVATFAVLIKELGIKDMVKATAVMVSTSLVVGGLMRLILIGLK